MTTIVYSRTVTSLGLSTDTIPSRWIRYIITSFIFDLGSLYSLGVGTVKHFALPPEGLAKMQRKDTTRTIPFKRRFWYAFCRIPVRLYFMIFYGARYFGRDNIPKQGGVLIVANHQSHYDPPLIGSGIPRRINYLARKTLFKFKPFAWLIDSLDAIPLDNQGIGFEGIKETIRRLKNGEMVLMFPEGTRTRDGKISPLKDGFLTLAIRGKAAILPVAISGAYETWPRFLRFPGPGRLKVLYGESISYETAKETPPDELHRTVEAQLHEMFEKIQGQ